MTVDRDTLEALVAGAAQQGPINVTKTMGGVRSWHASLTDRGLTEVRNRRERRGDAKLRAIAARQALLDWFYFQKRNGGHFPVTEGVLNDPRGHFEGAPFTSQEASDAGGYLKTGASSRPSEPLVTRSSAARSNRSERK